MSKSDIKIDLRGDKELKHLLETLPSRVAKKGLRKALNLASTPMLKDAKSKARRDTGLLRRSLKKKIKTYSSGVVVCLIGPDRNVVETDENGKRKRPANYSHLIEKGHKGKRPAPAYPFLRPAYVANQHGSLAIAKRVLLETLKAEAAKLKGKN